MDVIDTSTAKKGTSKNKEAKYGVHADKVKEAEDKVHVEALKRYDVGQAFDRENIILAEEDFAFVAGDGQWPYEIKQQRQLKKRPCLTFNRLPQFIAQVVGDARQNKPAIKVSPVDSGSDPDTAELLEGIIRHIESHSSAATAYLTAFEHCCSGGFGHWRVLTEYADDDTFEQEVKIQRITNPFAVTWDPGAIESNKQDAGWCFVTEYLTIEDFDARYPAEDGNVRDWQSPFLRREFGTWLDTNDRVRVAEYWCKKRQAKKISMMPDGTVVDGEADGAIRVRDSFETVIERYVMSGDKVLEGPESWAGTIIPIVTVFGPEEYIDSQVRYRSLIRHSKDAVRMYNYSQTSIAEKIALTPKAPYLLTKDQIKGLEGQWNNANSLDRNYLVYNSDIKAPGAPQRSQPAAVNVAEIQQGQQAIDDMKATIGIHDASLGARGNETSGKAILARQREGDTATFAWIDNLSRAIEHTGRILIDLIPRIYDSQRVVRILGEDETQKLVTINEAAPPNPFILDEQPLFNDLSVGKYDVRVSVGPSYNTKRQESAESMMAFISAVPQASPVIGDLIAKNMDWPGAEEIAKRLKKAIPAGLIDEDLTPEEQEQQQQEMQQQQQQQQMEQAMAKELFMLEKAKKEADIRAVEAKTEKDLAEAEAQEIENDAVETGVTEILQANG